jgi:hypothetical protein
MRVFKRRGLICALLVVAPGLLRAQADFDWALGAVYDPSVTTLDDFLARPFGARHTSVDEIVAYGRLLAERSDRVRRVEMGTSVEGDALVLLIITEPENFQRLEARTAKLEKIIDPWKYGERERRRAIDELLPLTWIACSVHGDEASGSDAGLLLAYHLAADDSDATRDILSRSVVVIDPCQNPDGRRRFLTHVRAFRRQRPGPDADPYAMEHNQLWPGGRRNHYLFDLNRDWAYGTQQETRARVGQFMRLRPQVFVDLHEMGRESSYFFPPPSDPVNPNVPPELREWWDVFGRANAKMFDARGFDYFVRESFDLFYPGYGDSWPTLQGAVGMTYEQATTRGLALRRDGGEVVFYKEAVLRHFTAALTTCATAALNDRDLVDSFGRFFDIAKQRVEDESPGDLVLLAGARPQQAHAFAATLMRQGITVFRTTEAKEARLRPYIGGERRSMTIPAGSLRIPRAQPSHALLRSLIDLHTPMDDHFLAQERRRKERGLENRFYDVTAWSLVLSHGLFAYESDASLDVASVPLDPGEPFLGGLEPRKNERDYAYLFPYDDNATLAALCRLLWRDVRFGMARDGFRQDGRDYPRGTLVVKTRENADLSELETVVAEIARRSGARAYRSSTAWTEAGPALGSERILPLRRPEIAVLSGPGVSPASLGALRFVLEARYEIPHSLVLAGTLAEAELRKFDTLVLPDFGAEPQLDVEALDRWIRAGGNLVAIGRAAAWVTELEEVDWTTSELVLDLSLLEENSAGHQGDPALAEAAGDNYVPRDRRPDRTPGAIARLLADLDHLFAVGGDEQFVAPVMSDRLLRASRDGQTVVSFAQEDARLAGFMWPSMEEAIRGLAYLVHERHGAGHVVLFAEDPAFRGAWEGLDRLLLHAILLPKSLGP